jgi:hypothetical protein
MGMEIYKGQVKRTITTSAGMIMNIIFGPGYKEHTLVNTPL